MRPRATLARYEDPDGTIHGLPTWPWGVAWRAAPGLATRRQLTQLGLRPGGQDPAGQIMWRSRRGPRPDRVRTALLYKIDEALPKRTPTPAQWAALARAIIARQTCRTDRGGCGRVLEHEPPRRLGVCLDCADLRDLEAMT